MPFLLFAAVAAVVCCAFLLLPRSRATTDRGVDRFAQRTGLAVPDRLRPALRDRLAWQRRASGLVATATLVAVMAVVAGFSGAALPTPSAQLILGASFASGAVGNAVAVLLRRDPQPAGVRVARGRSVTLADYVPPVERTLAWIVAALALVAVAVVAAVSGPTPLDLVAGALLVASLLLLELGGRRIVHRRQRAGDPAELAWDDAFRSMNLQALALAPILTGLYAAIATTVSLTAADGGVLGLVAGIAALLVVMAGNRQQRRRYFVRRLWPIPVAMGAAA